LLNGYCFDAPELSLSGGQLNMLAITILMISVGAFPTQLRRTKREQR